MIPLPPLVAVVLVAYLAFSVWNAYSTGCNRAMLRRHNVKGVIQYGPYLSLTVSFFGVMIAVFLCYELVGYYTGTIRLNLPSDLSNLDFFTFLIMQFSDIRLRYIRYVLFLAFGLVISGAVSFVVVDSIYRKGLAKIRNSPIR